MLSRTRFVSFAIVRTLRAIRPLRARVRRGAPARRGLAPLKPVLLGLLLVASLFPQPSPPAFARGDERRARPGDGHEPPAAPERPGLPDYDLRAELEGDERNAARAAGADERAALAALRARFTQAPPESLRVEMGASGVPKVVFNYDGPLTGPRDASPDAAARGFLAEHGDAVGLTPADAAGVRLDNEHEYEGLSFLEYAQTIDGIEVYNSDIKVVVGPRGEVVSYAQNRVLPGAHVDARPALTEDEAIARAFEYAGADMRGGLVLLEPRASEGARARYANPAGEEREDVLSALRVVAVAGEGRLAYQVFVDVGPSEWYEVLVDARTGELILRRNLYSCAAEGMVFDQHPAAGDRALLPFTPRFGVSQSDVWLPSTSTVTTGNNADAYLDSDANNVADPITGGGLSEGHATSSAQSFMFPFLTGVDPRTQRAAVVTNLFYHVNYMHDWMYSLGFTETARNFQQDNFGRGGSGSDRVKAEAQDGANVSSCGNNNPNGPCQNNANFATPPDGQSGRMQQFLFTMGTASLADDRDSSMDADVIYHEYGHGVSNRLVGNSSGLTNHQGRAMGEGWSDYWAVTAFDDGVMGEFVTNDPVDGIRRAAYSVPADPVHDSVADLGGSSVHADGEIWCATLFDLRESLRDLIGVNAVDRLVLNGMKFTPSSPSFLNARDGILQADQNLNGGANRCVIWQVFARHGMGLSAGGNNGTTAIPASDVPSDCDCSSSRTRITPGQTLSGTLSSDDCMSTVRTSSHQDTFAFSAVAGVYYTITMRSSAFDAWLVLKSPTNTLIAEADDGDGGTNAKIVFAATQSGTHWIEATSDPAGATGAYTVALAGGEKNLVRNGGFEQGPAEWTQSATGIINSDNSPAAFQGAFKAEMTASVFAPTRSLHQAPVFPSRGVAKTLRFHLAISTSELPFTGARDRLHVRITNASGGVLATLRTFDNTQSRSFARYALVEIPIRANLAVSGNRLRFDSSNDALLATTFAIDTVSIQ
jgi:Zn-dependent metalloprotease